MKLEGQNGESDMNAKFQDIQPKRAGLRCEVQIINHQGHGVLTTFDPAVDNSVEIAQADLASFFDECIESFNKGRGGGLTPNVWGRKPEGEMDLIDIKAPDFDLGLFEQITVMPTPMSGG
jgi:hypothetical protein